LDQETGIKLAIYHHFAETGRAPTPEGVAGRVGSDVGSVLVAYRSLQKQRVLVLAEDGASIIMAPPFSGVPTQHVVESGGVEYFANCAWDALGVPAALQREGTVKSRCEQTLEPLVLEVSQDGTAPTDWVFHCLVPAAHWWDDVVFT